MNIKYGDVYMVDFAAAGNVLWGKHPAVVTSNNKGNRYSPNVIVVPLTSSIKKVYLPTHVLLDARENGLMKNSMALCENPMTIPKNTLLFFCTHLPEKAMKEIAVAQLAAMTPLTHLDQETIQAAKELSQRLDVA